MGNLKTGLYGGAIIAIAVAAAPADAQSLGDRRRFNIPSQTLAEALIHFSRQSSIQIVTASADMGKARSAPVIGAMTSRQALDRLLSGSGMQWRDVGAGSVAVTPARSRSGGQAAPAGDVGQGPALSSSEDASDPPGGSSEIIVTAQRREQRTIDVPMSVSVLSGAQLSEQRLTNLLDISRTVPGMVVNDAGPGRRRLSLRGVGNTFGAQPLVGLYLDEVSVAGFNDAVIDLQTYDLERVEVLRGPQGTLYGEGSTSGTIRFITRKPSLDRASLGATLKAFTSKGGEPGLDLDAAANIPIVTDTLALRVSGRYLADGGWVDQPLLGRENINDQSLLDARFQLRWRPTPGLTADAMVILHRNDGGASNRGEDEDGNYTQAFLMPTTPSADDNFNIYNLTLSYDAGPVRLLSATSLIDVRKRLRNDGNTIPLLAPPTPAFQFLNLSQDSDGKSFSQEFRVSSNGRGPLTYTLGAFYRDSQLDRYSESIFGLTLPTAFAFSQTDENGSESWSIFGDAAYKLTPRLEIGAGLRYFVDHRTNYDGFATQKARFESLNPRVYVRFEISDTASIYANVAKGFRTGGFNGAGQPAYDPETLWSYEIGAKASLLDRRLNAEATAFYSDYSNVQVVGITGTSLGQSVTSNLGEAWVKGIEGSASFTPVEGLALGATASVYSTRITALNVGGASHQVGDPLDNVPKYTLSGWAEYEFPLGADTAGAFRVNYGRKGVSYYRNRSVGSFFIGQSDLTDLLDLSLEVRRARWRFVLYGDNILNERGYLDPFAIEGSASRPRPRTVGISAGFTI